MKNILIATIMLFLTTSCVGRKIKYDNNDRPIKQNTIIDNKSNEIINNQYNKNYGIYDKYKSFILKVNPKISTYLAVTIANIVDVYAKEYNLDSKLILALISKESSFRPNAVSSSGAVGLGQLLKQTAKDMGIKDPYNPEENIKATTKYLSILIKKWNGNINLALASYKIGHGNVTRLVKAGDELPLSTKKYIKEIITAQSKI